VAHHQLTETKTRCASGIKDRIKGRKSQQNRTL
jgi:hypothetical protein